MTDYKAKMHQIRFRLGLRPSPGLEVLTALPRPPCWIWGPFCGRGAGEEEGKRWGRGGRGSGGNGKGGPQVTVEPVPLRDLLRH